MKVTRYFFLFTFLFLSRYSFAQEDLFESTKLPARKGFLLGVNGNFDFSAGDMSQRFGNNYRIGPSFHYKTKSNWIFGVKFDFLNGDKIKEDSMFNGIQDGSGTFVNQDGQRIAVNRYERGYMTGIEVGHIFNISKSVSDNGIMIMTGVGFMQHRILIQDKSESILSLRGDYRKGYDRLTNGLYVEQYVGYLFLSNNGLINFHIGLDASFGFTQGRRDFLYDVRRPGNDKRVDILFGIRGGWYLPMFKRKSEEFFFE
jgi:hypothetical protein